MPSTKYNVTITALVGPDASTGKGFIDHKKIETYMAEGSSPTTAAQSIDKERANSRYEMLVAKLGLLGNIYISNMTATGANATTAATAFSFTLESEHGDGPLVTDDELNEGDILEGADALKRVIARAMTTNRASDFSEYYDPTTSTAPANGGTAPAAVRVGSRIERITVGALANAIVDAEAAVSVTKI